MSADVEDLAQDKSIKTAGCQSSHCAGARKSRPGPETSLDQGSRAFIINLSKLVFGTIEACFSASYIGKRTLWIASRYLGSRRSQVSSARRTLEDFRRYFDTPLFDPASDAAASSLVVQPLRRGSRGSAPAGDPAFSAVVPNGNAKFSSLRRRHRFEVEHQVTNRRLCSANLFE